MRLLVLDQFSDPGGAQQCLLEFLPAVKERGWSALVGLPGEGEMFERVRQAGFETARIRCGPYHSGRKSWGDAARFAGGTPLLARQIRRLAEKVGAELVYVVGPRLLPAVALAGLRLPVLFHSQSYLFPGAVRRMAGMALRKCRAQVVGACRFVAEPWKAFVPPGGVDVIYNGVAGPRNNSLTRDKLKHVATMGCIGRIAPEKGQREFVEAAAIIRRALPECRFVIYGAALFSDRSARRYEQEVQAAGAKAGVEFGGWVTDVYSALDAIDLLLVPSAGHEATTRVILEAYAAGVPVIAFRSGGIPEVVDDGRDGWLAGSAEEMARLAIELLRGDPEKLAAAALAAGGSWRQRFTIARYHEQLFAAMERAVRQSWIAERGS
ncbi:MAG TPA: glycosyltransferase family 4 protein [Bryobacteraceae bacterium]|nr:glycosyltransferase family 4 protein [Bryobacteraceae bacterium]